MVRSQGGNRRIALFRGLLKVFESLVQIGRGGPFVLALFAAEKIDSLIRVKDLKEVAQ